MNEDIFQFDHAGIITEVRISGVFTIFDKPIHVEKGSLLSIVWNTSEPIKLVLYCPDCVDLKLEGIPNIGKAKMYCSYCNSELKIIDVIDHK